MILKLTSILLYAFIAFLLALFIYPTYIKLLKKRKAGQSIREADVTGNSATIYKQLHKHKGGTPSMGGGIILLIVFVMVLGSLLVQELGRINNSLLTRQETYMPLFGFFSMGILGLIDDYINIKGKTLIKGLSAKIKFIWMFLFSGFISWWFYWKLGIDTINLRPFAGELYLGFFMPILTFFGTVIIVNAINIADGLDGLVGGLGLIVLGSLGVITFITQWYLASTVITIIAATLIAFLRYNINPAKIFLGDSGALALGGIISTMIYLLNINFGILIPAIILMLLFWIEFASSFLQITRKKLFKKKLFPIAPYHHLLEYLGQKEHTIVMRFWLIQGILAMIALLSILYQLFL